MISREEIRQLMNGISLPIREFVDRALDPVRQRLDALESKPDVHYEGVFAADRTYAAGSLVTRSGGL